VRIAVIGNCQARPLASALTAAIPGLEVLDVVIVHLADQAEADKTLAAIDGADFVLAQRVVDNYPTQFVRTDELRRHFGARLLVWPNLYYRGYNPELVYLRDSQHRALQGPFGEYHVSTIHEAWRQGLSVVETVERLKSVDFNREKFAMVPDESLAELIEREADCDLRVSDVVAEDRWKTRLFFTFNHPTSAALDILVTRMLGLLGVPNASAGQPGEPLGRWRLPLNPWVKSEFAPSFQVRGNFLGSAVEYDGDRPKAVGPPVPLNYRELTREYFTVYDKAFTAQS